MDGTDMTALLQLVKQYQQEDVVARLTIMPEFIDSLMRLPFGVGNEWFDAFPNKYNIL